MTTDTQRLDAFEVWANRGLAPALVFDDDGRWAVSFSGISPVPEPNGHTEEVGVITHVEPQQWKDSVREAIDAAIAAEPTQGEPK